MKTRFGSLLPELLAPIQAVLRREGFSAQAEGLDAAEVERWTYDESVNAGYIYLVQREPVGLEEVPAAKTIVLMDDYSFNVDLRAHGDIWGVELLDHAAVFERLGATRH